MAPRRGAGDTVPVEPELPDTEYALILQRAAADAGVDMADETIADLAQGKYTRLSGSGLRKLGKIVDILQRDEIDANAEDEQAQKLGHWLAAVNPESVRVYRTATTDATAFEPVTLTDGAERFYLGSFLGNDENLAALSLPPAVEAELAEKRTACAKLGIENGGQLERFTREHFEYSTFDPSGPIGEQPVEIQWLARNEPEAYEVLKTNAISGNTCVLRHLKTSPDPVIRGLKNIATYTQYTYYTNWLPGLIKHDTDPTILPTDRKGLETAHTLLLEELDDQLQKGTIDATTHELLKEQISSRFESDVDFDAALDSLRLIRELSLGIEIHASSPDTPEHTETERRAIAELNDTLQMRLGNQYAYNKLLFDVAHGDAEGMIKILRLIPAFIAAAWGLEHVPIKEVAQAAKIMGAGDDLLMEGGTIAAQLAKGVTWETIKRRFLPIGTTVLAALGMGYSVDTVAETSWHLAGGLFALSTIAVSGVTQLLNGRSYAQSYVALAHEGKIAGHKGILTTEDQETLHGKIAEISQNDEQADLIAEISPVIKGLLDDKELSPRKLRKTLALIEQMVRDNQIEHIGNAGNIPTHERYHEAYRELLATNPAYKPIIGALMVMPFIGAAAGPWLLTSPAYYVPSGAGESVSGYVGAKVNQRSFKNRWRKWVEQQP